MRNSLGITKLVAVLCIIINLSLIASNEENKEKSGVCNCSGCQKTEDGYENLYNGKNLDGWKLICRKGGEETAKKIFTPVEGGIIHVYKNFPDGYQLDEGKNDTHAMMLTKKKYSRYIFTFEYKWGKKRTNNFGKLQYDAGAFYHVYKEGVWPRGAEYQVRYDHTKNQNHTGDIWNCGFEFTWYKDENNCFKMPENGGKKVKQKGGEHKASADAKFHGLNDKWNKCEIIVMADKYAIHRLNGKVVNYLTDLNLKEGIIGLQAETAEIFYRNIKIREFGKNIPAENFLKK